MDAIELLTKDHAKVDALFRRFNDGGGLTGAVKRLTGNAASPRQRKTIGGQICQELEVHARIEEARFYPAVRALDDERLNALLDESLREHGTIKDRVGQVRTALDDDEALRAAVASLQECVEHHVREEEREMFPLLEDRMPAPERASLGRDLAAQKRQAPGRRARPAHPAVAARSRKKTSRRTTTTAAARPRTRRTRTKARKTSKASRASRR